MQNRSTIEYLAETSARIARARRDFKDARHTVARNLARSKLVIAQRRRQIASEQIDWSQYR